MGSGSSCFPSRERGEAPLWATSSSPPPNMDGTFSSFARRIFAITGLDPDRVTPTTTDNFPRPARRPAYSVLGHDRWAAAGLAPMDDWQRSLEAAAARHPFASLIPSTSGWAERT